MLVLQERFRPDGWFATGDEYLQDRLLPASATGLLVPPLGGKRLPDIGL